MVLSNRSYFIFIYFVFNYFLGLSFYGQTKLILRPNGESGKDCVVASSVEDKSFPRKEELLASAWTSSGVPTFIRGLIEFDLSTIPQGSKVLHAYLSLYSYRSRSNGNHSTSGGPNECVLRRVVEEWSPNTATWNNQPSSTEQNQVFLIESIQSIEDYIDIDVTRLVQDMINYPSESFGFLFKLDKEKYYRRMIFASSKNRKSKLHPKLEVIYSEK